jgi:hypothetical protein
MSVRRKVRAALVVIVVVVVVAVVVVFVVVVPRLYFAADSYGRWVLSWCHART